jgi:hypothetical protein
VRNGPFLVSDESDYVDAASTMLSGHPFIPYWSPGLPLYLMPFVAAGASNLVLRASMLLFWVLLSWGILRLCRAAGVGNLAWLILLVFAVMPDSIQLSTEVQTEQVVAAFLVIALSAAVRCAKGAGLGEFVLLGLSAGYMSLVRPSALPLLFLLPLACFFLVPGSWTKRLAGPVLSLLLGGAMVCGWMVRAHQLSGAWILNTSNAVNLFYGNNPWTPMYRTWYFGSHAKLGDPEIKQFPEYEKIIQTAHDNPGGMTGLASNHMFQQLATQDIRDHPGIFLLRDANRIRCYFGFDTFTSANLHTFGGLAAKLVPVTLLLEAATYLCIAAPAFFFLASAPASFWRRGETWMMTGALVLYAIPYWMSKSHPTYHYPVLGLIAVLAAAAWQASRGSAWAWMRGWIALGLLALIQIEWVWQMATSPRS